MRLAIDAMGNDNGPGPIIEGVRDYVAADRGTEVLLVGREPVLQPLLHEAGLNGSSRVRVVHADDVIEMDDKLQALREKRESSIGRTVQLVKDGEADGMVALGNTMAAVASTRLGLKYLEGVHRAGIAVPMPAAHGVCVVIDMGANVNCKPRHLCAYAIMAAAYARLVLGIEAPRVGLLNVGEEDVKGNTVAKEAFALLSEAPTRFIGNVEGGDIFNGKCDVVVCDGFVGNAVLKASEAVAAAMADILRDNIRRSWLCTLGAVLARPAIKELKRKANSDQYGGAPLLGVDGVCIIGHGGSNPTAVRNALRVAHESVAQGLNGVIHEKLIQANGVLHAPADAEQNAAAARSA
ncbi:MAG: phosphate acyltransferase PlsX [Planctomycetota bacterium]